jgi:hypothetical protein
MVAVAFAALALAGCEKRGPVIIADIDWGDRPVVNTPAGVVQRFSWHWFHRDTTRYGEMFAADFEFAFQNSDTAGNFYRDRVLTRDLEIAVGKAILVTGTVEEPPPAGVLLTFGPTLAALPDPRPGKSAIAHRLITPEMFLRVEQPDLEIRGGARIYVVRGDSAAWPPGVPHAGPDSARWFIQRWEDLTGGDETSRPAATMPASNKTLGQLKALYRQHDGARSLAARHRSR